MWLSITLLGGGGGGPPASCKVTVVDTAGESCEHLFFLCPWKGTNFSEWVQKLEGRVTAHDGVVCMRS